MNIEHKLEPIEHWIVDGKAYRLATEQDVGKEVYFDDYGIEEAMSDPHCKTLTGITKREKGFWFHSNVGWRFAYIQDDSLLTPQRTPVPALGDGWYLLTAEDGDIQPGDKICSSGCNSWIYLPQGHEWPIGRWVAQGNRAARYFGPTEDAEIEPGPTEEPTPKPIDWTKPVRTKDGRAVRVLCTDGPGGYPVVGFIGDNTCPDQWTLDGLFCVDERHALDLENAPQRIQREYWVNVYKDHVGGQCKTQAIAKDMRENGCIACVKITIDCEEGEGL